MGKPVEESFSDKIDDINYEVEQLDFKRQELLRKTGWKLTCDVPGSLWLWEKAVRGRVLMVNQSSALAIETWLQEFPEPEPVKI